MPTMATVTQRARGEVSEHDIYQRLVSAILDHRLLPGTKLVEDRLAEAFGVSRTLVRPALVRLSHEHLVHLRANRGATVTEPTPEEAREVFEARRLIEPSLVSHCIERATAEDLSRLQACVQAEERAQALGDRRASVRLSGQFHLEVAAIGAQLTLERMLKGLVSRTSLILMAYGSIEWSDSSADQACDCCDHRVLLEAIRLGAAQEAGRLMDDHLRAIENSLDWSRRLDGDLPLRDLLGLNEVS